MATKQAPPFEAVTFLKTIKGNAIARPVGGGQVTVDIPRSGFLARVYLQYSATIAGTLSAPNQWGVPSVLRHVRVSLNTGTDLVRISGPGYHYGLREGLDLGFDPVPQASRAAVTAATFNQDMVLPIAANLRDTLGLVNLQAEDTLAQLSIDFEADATVATGATITGSVTPYYDVFEVPADPASWPKTLGLYIQTIEDQVSVPAGADYTYNWPRGGTYISTAHIFAPGYTRAQLRYQQSGFPYDFDPAGHLTQINSLTQRDFTLSGTAITGFNKRIFFDRAKTSGLGMFAMGRDEINSARLTDLATVITPVGAGTLINVRRQIVRSNAATPLS